MSADVLNLARRSAPQIIKRKPATQPSLPMGLSTQSIIIRDGAMPKVTRSANESYSIPNLLVVFVALAIFPSKRSKIPPIKIAIAASANRASTEARIA